MKTSEKQKQMWIKQIEECLIQYYRLPSCKRNQWRFNDAFENAKNRINNDLDVNQGKTVLLKGAQWGAKWGNYYRMIALNSKNEYQYTEGFNPHKYLI